MVRPLKPRCIGADPTATYFKPRGIPLRNLEQITLTLDEVEALRLKYLAELEQTQAAAKMGVSQSTFQRILAMANKKVADALLGGKAIRIEGGTVRKKK
ncbi:MAG: DUF134 domain-containing protein [Candidatus Peribacteraceae bacterium]|nr:DUF134 domain-containing protein [Candidatus Peribacteraceae bacterium]MDD5742927.1 DUF134 domain-containing protein [Candidatus Peribacteraceae bacterium]